MASGNGKEGIRVSWEPGDRVIVRLPAGRRGRSGTRRRDISGTVRETDTVEGHPGVRVDLDYPVNGVQDCYAVHGELRPLNGEARQ